MWVQSGLLVGFPSGFAVHRSDFCMHSALGEAVARRPGRSPQASLVALGLQLVGVNGLGGMALLRVSSPPVQAEGPRPAMRSRALNDHLCPRGSAMGLALGPEVWL
jgi:hypothetical protein